MGAAQSGGYEIAGSTMGYQVLRVYPDSPGSRAGLRAYFDFIIAIGNTRFNKENGSLREILKASVNQKLTMVVFNTRTKTVRNVEIVPSTSWGGNGLLGVSIKHSSFDRADERVWHVVEVEPGSPAHQAGFKATEDYVIGSDSILQENDDLYNLIEAHEGKALKLFVYNVKTDNCREVICYPNSKWGGRGYLGCEFGHGLLHRVPVGTLDEQVANEAAKSAQATTAQAQNTNPYSFQGQFSQLHNNNTSNSDINNMSSHNIQRPAMNMQPGEQMLHKALFDGALPPQQHKQEQQLHDQQQRISFQQQQASSLATTLPPPPIQTPQTFAQLASVQQQTQQYHQEQQQHQQTKTTEQPSETASSSYDLLSTNHPSRNPQQTSASSSTQEQHPHHQQPNPYPQQQQQHQNTTAMMMMEQSQRQQSMMRQLDNGDQSSSQGQLGAPPKSLHDSAHQPSSGQHQAAPYTSGDYPPPCSSSNNNNNVNMSYNLHRSQPQQRNYPPPPPPPSASASASSMHQPYPPPIYEAGHLRSDHQQQQSQENQPLQHQQAQQQPVWAQITDFSQQQAQQAATNNQTDKLQQQQQQSCAQQQPLPPPPTAPSQSTHQSQLDQTPSMVYPASPQMPFMSSASNSSLHH